MQENSIGDKFFIQIFKGVVVGLIFTTVAVLAFALILAASDLPDTVIRPVNQFVKIVAVFTACVFSVREKRGYLKGGVIGLLLSLSSFLLFGLVGGEFGGFLSLVIDALFGCVAGVLSGVIAVNLPFSSR